eukprot:tig00001239_g7766.t1
MEPTEMLDVDSNGLESMLLKLERLKREAERDQDYAKAQVVASGIQKVKADINEFKRRQLEEAALMEKEGLASATEELGMHLAAEWDARETLLREENLRQLDALRRKHREERGALDERTHEKMRPEAFKASPALQTLEKKHQGHARLGEYERAHEARGQWAALEAREKDAWQRRIYASYVDQLERLQLRHNAEMRVLLEGQEAAARKLIADRERAFEITQKRYANALRDVDRKYAVLVTNAKRYGGFAVPPAALRPGAGPAALLRLCRLPGGQAPRPAAPRPKRPVLPAPGPPAPPPPPPRPRDAPPDASLRRERRPRPPTRPGASPRRRRHPGLGRPAAPRAGRPHIRGAAPLPPGGPLARRGSGSGGGGGGGGGSGPPSSREASPARKYEDVYSTPRSRPLSAPRSGSGSRPSSAPRSRPSSAKGRTRSPASPSQAARRFAELDVSASFPRMSLSDPEITEPASPPRPAASAAAPAPEAFDPAPAGVVEAASIALGFGVDMRPPPRKARPLSGRIGSFM